MKTTVVSYGRRDRKLRFCFGVLFLVASFSAMAPALTFALDGSAPLQLSTSNGWSAFELITQGDRVEKIADPGYGSVASKGEFDGLGAYRQGDSISILMNHETTQAAISRVDTSRSALRQAVASRLAASEVPFPNTIVSAVGYAYETIFDANYHAITHPNSAASGIDVVAYADAQFTRLCSGTLHEAEVFGVGRGIVDQMFITGEEPFDGTGQLFAVDTATSTLWEIGAVGGASWENAAQFDTKDTDHIALLLTSDLDAPPGDYLRLYVGKKGIDANADGTIDFLERNGLRGGQMYYFTPDMGGSVVDLPDGIVSGKWSLSTAAALRDDKVEDIDVNPLNGNQAVFNATNDGIYRIDVTLMFSEGQFNPAESPAIITQLYDDDVAPIGEPDNITWSKDGKLYVQEDSDGNQIWQLNADGTGAVLIAAAFAEPSGIDDVSALLGYEPGSVLISSVLGLGVSGAQLLVMVSPDAAPLSATADFVGDGEVNGADILHWQVGVGLKGVADVNTGDANYDGNVDRSDLAIWRLQFGASTNGQRMAIPEPGAVLLVALLLPMAYRPHLRRQECRIAQNSARRMWQVRRSVAQLRRAERCKQKRSIGNVSLSYVVRLGVRQAKNRPL